MPSVVIYGSNFRLIVSPVDCCEEGAALQFFHQLEPSAGGHTPKQPRTALRLHGYSWSEIPHHYSVVYSVSVPHFPTRATNSSILAAAPASGFAGLPWHASATAPTLFLCCFFKSMSVAMLCWNPAGQETLFICQKIRNWLHVKHRPWSCWSSRTSENVLGDGREWKNRVYCHLDRLNQFHLNSCAYTWVIN